MQVIQEGKGEGVAEIVRMQKVLCTETPDSCAPGRSVIFNHVAEILESRVLPEVESALDLEIAAVDCAGKTGITVGLVGVIVVDEEESVTPLVTLEHLESGRDVLAVLAQIEEGL